jgi:hypothetical protein
MSVDHANQIRGPETNLILQSNLFSLTNRRFIQDKYRSPGPIYPGQSSIGKQIPSHMATAGGVGFGTSTRAGALKTYATYTV